MPTASNTDNQDVFVTIGNPDALLLIEHARYIDSNTIKANTFAEGRGKWGDYTEFSAFFLWTDVTSAEAAEIRAIVTNSGHEFNQDAVGILTVPAGSALVLTAD